MPLLLVSAALLVSGAAALVYQIVWLRMLGLVFGHAVDALTAVLVAFMAGLALGSALFGRWSPRLRAPLAAYAWLEAGVALYAVCLPIALPALTRASLALRGALGLSYDGWSLLQVALAFLVLLPPTVLMGGTLPLVAQALAADGSSPGRRVGAFYALNTWGALAGALAAGYWLLPALGNRATVWTAAGANIAAGMLAVIASRRMRSGASPDALGPRLGSTGAVSPARGEGSGWLIPVVMAVSGAAAMIFEVAWTRALSLLLGSSTYAFTAMLVAVLVGLAAGSAVYAWRWGDRAAGPAALGLIEVGVGISGAALLWGFDRLPDLVLAGLRVSMSPAWVELLQIFVSAAALTTATLWMGAAFPCAIAAAVGPGEWVGQGVGRIYAANTAGAVLGVLLGGLVLVPAWGAHGALKAAVAATLLLGAALLAIAPAGRVRRGAFYHVAAAAPLVLALAVIFLPSWDARVMSSAPAVYARTYLEAAGGRRLRDVVGEQTVLFYRDGRSGTVAVTRQGDQILLRVNGKIDAGSVVDMPTQLLVAHLPLLVHAAPRDVFILGLGSGVTAGAAARHPVARVDVLEIEPAIVEASRFFRDLHGDVLRDPRVRVVIGDGRNFLLASPARYDVIISEPSNPWMSGLAALFSREFFLLARERLRAGGVMLQWVQSYHLAPDDLKMVIATFRSAFPATTMWEATPGDFLLLGQVEHTPLDARRLRARWEAEPGLRADLERLGIGGWAGLLGFFALGEDDTARLAGAAGLNTDDRLPLEWSAPRSLYIETSLPNRALAASLRSTDLPALTPESASLLERAEHRYWAGMGCLRRAAPAAALVHLDRALALDPGHAPAAIAAATAALQLGRAGPALEFALRALHHQQSAPPPAALFLAGVASWWLGRTDEAGRYLAGAVALEPGNVEFQDTLRRFKSGTLSR
jgi:spermidine synthase